MEPGKPMLILPSEGNIANLSIRHTVVNASYQSLDYARQTAAINAINEELSPENQPNINGIVNEERSDEARSEEINQDEILRTVFDDLPNNSPFRDDYVSHTERRLIEIKQQDPDA